MWVPVRSTEPSANKEKNPEGSRADSVSMLGLAPFGNAVKLPRKDVGTASPSRMIESGPSVGEPVPPNSAILMVMEMELIVPPIAPKLKVEVGANAGPAKPVPISDVL